MVVVEAVVDEEDMVEEEVCLLETDDSFCIKNEIWYLKVATEVEVEVFIRLLRDGMRFKMWFK